MGPLPLLCPKTSVVRLETHIAYYCSWCIYCGAFVWQWTHCLNNLSKRTDTLTCVASPMHLSCLSLQKYASTSYVRSGVNVPDAQMTLGISCKCQMHVIHVHNVTHSLLDKYTHPSYQTYHSRQTLKHVPVIMLIQDVESVNIVCKAPF